MGRPAACEMRDAPIGPWCDSRPSHGAPPPPTVPPAISRQKILAVGGASGDVPPSLFGRILKWPTRADCKSAGLRPTLVRIQLLPPSFAQPLAVATTDGRPSPRQPTGVRNSLFPGAGASRPGYSFRPRDFPARPGPPRAGTRRLHDLLRIQRRPRSGAPAL